MAEQYSKEAQQRQVARAAVKVAAMAGLLAWSLWPHRHEIIDGALQARQNFYDWALGKQDSSVPAPEVTPGRRLVPGASTMICRNFVAVVPLEPGFSLIITDPAITAEGDVFSKIGYETLVSPVPVDAWIDLKTAQRVEPYQINCQPAQHVGIDAFNRPLSSDRPQPACAESITSLNWRRTGGYSDIVVVPDATGEDLITDLIHQQAAYTTPCESGRTLI